MKNKIILPSVFENIGGKPEYEKYKGMPKLSYSQIGSWNNPEYRESYYRNKFFGLPAESSIFTEFGSACGTFIESIGTDSPKVHDKYRTLLKEEDRQTIINKVHFPENSIYEDYICLNVDDEFVIEGYADRITYLSNNRIVVQDFKTGSIKTKSKEYSSDDYNQTRLYAYAKELEGYEVGKCEVILLDRKGNGMEKYPLKLTGEVAVIPNKYDHELIQKFLDKARKTAREISEEYQRFLKLTT